MAYKGLMDDVRAAVALKQPKQVPIFANSEEFDVKWHGQYDYEEVCQSGDKMAEVWIAATEEFDYDWVWLQVDDCFEFEAIGVGTRGEGNILRATTEYLPTTRETLKNLPSIDPKTAGRMPEKLKAIRKARDHFGDDACITGACAAPYSSVGLLYHIEEAMVMMYTDPQLLRDTCEYFVELQSKFAIAQVEAGAHTIWLGDCNAFSGLLSVEQFREWAFDSCKKVVDAIKKAGGLVHLHNSEIEIPHLMAEAELGVSIVSAGPAADIAEVKKAYAGKQCFSGNLDPIEVLMRGTPELVASEAKRIMETCKEGGGYIFSTGEMNPRDVTEENFRAYMKAARDCSKY